MATLIDFGPEDQIEQAIMEEKRLMQAKQHALYDLYLAFQTLLDMPVGDYDQEDIIAFDEAEKVYAAAYKAWDNHFRTNAKNKEFLDGLEAYCKTKKSKEN